MTHGRISNPRMAAAAFNQANSHLQQSYVLASQVQEIEGRKQQRAVEYETAKYALESARDSARKKRDIFAGLVPVQAELESILTDETIDAEMQHRKLVRLSVKYMGEAQTNPAVASALNNTIQASQFGVQQQGRTNSKYTVGKFMEQGGPPELLEKYAKGLGRPLSLEDELPAVDSFKAVTEYKQKLFRSKREEEAEQKQEAKAESTLTAAVSEISRISLVEPDPASGDTRKGPQFKNPMHEAHLDVVVGLVGTGVEQAAYAEASPAEKMAIAGKVAKEFLTNRKSRPLNATGSTRTDISGKDK